METAKTPQAGVDWPTAPPPHRPLRTGDPATVGPYRLEALLGAGGMGRVYLGHTPAGSAVAVKVVHREYAEDQAFRRRFEQEVATARLVQGLYTVPVVDADTQADEPWLATAYIPGPSLQHAVAEHGPLPVDATVILVARIAEALQSIHTAGVIHRDLKPSNVILTAEGPKVIDFGIARAAELTSITGTGGMPGTPAYMAPEQILNQELTPAADVFALGILTTFAATGKLVFDGGSIPAIMHQILQQEPALDGCPEPLRAVAAHCLIKDPVRRPTPSEIIRQLSQPADGEPAAEARPTRVDSEPDATAAVGAPPRSGTRLYPSTESGPFLTRRRLLQAAGIVGGAGVLGGAGIALSTLFPEHRSLNLSSLPLAATLPGSHISDLAFSPDGTVLAASTRDGAIKLWDAENRKESATLIAEETGGEHVSLSCVAFSPDGRTLAASGGSEYDGLIKLWNVADRRLVATLRGPGSSAIETVAFSPAGGVLAGSQDRNPGNTSTITLWDFPSGKEQATLTLGEIHGGARVAFSADGRILAAHGLQGLVQLWDVAGRHQVATLTPAEVMPDGQGVAFSPDGRLFATAGGVGPKLWDVASRDEIATVPLSGMVLNSVLFSPDSGTLAVRGSYPHEDTLILVDVADRVPISHTVIGSVGKGSAPVARAMAYRPDGRTIATSHGDSLKLWSLP
jgi:serine/threonine protein kinase